MAKRRRPKWTREKSKKYKKKEGAMVIPTQVGNELISEVGALNKTTNDAMALSATQNLSMTIQQSSHNELDTLLPSVQRLPDYRRPLYNIGGSSKKHDISSSCHNQTMYPTPYQNINNVEPSANRHLTLNNDSCDQRSASVKSTADHQENKQFTFYIVPVRATRPPVNGVFDFMHGFTHQGNPSSDTKAIASGLPSVHSYSKEPNQPISFTHSTNGSEEMPVTSAISSQESSPTGMKNSTSTQALRDFRPKRPTSTEGAAKRICIVQNSRSEISKVQKSKLTEKKQTMRKFSGWVISQENFQGAADSNIPISNDEVINIDDGEDNSTSANDIIEIEDDNETLSVGIGGDNDTMSIEDENENALVVHDDIEENVASSSASIGRIVAVGTADIEQDVTTTIQGTEKNNITVGNKDNVTVNAKTNCDDGNENKETTSVNWKIVKVKRKTDFLHDMMKSANELEESKLASFIQNEFERLQQTLNKDCRPDSPSRKQIDSEGIVNSTTDGNSQSSSDCVDSIEATENSKWQTQVSEVTHVKAADTRQASTKVQPQNVPVQNANNITIDTSQKPSTSYIDPIISRWSDLAGIKLSEFDEYTREFLMNQIDNYLFRAKVKIINTKELEKEKQQSTFSEVSHKPLRVNSDQMNAKYSSLSGFSLEEESEDMNMQEPADGSWIEIKEEELDLGGDSTFD